MKKLSFAIAAICASGALHAQPQCTNLIYQGAPFTSLVTTGPNFTPLVPLAGTVTLSTPLPPNAVNMAVTPVAWNFSVESSNLVSASPLNTTGNGPFFFSTDANGNIIGWQFTVAWASHDIGGENQGFNMGVSTTQAGDYVGSAYYDGPIGVPPPINTDIVGNSSTAGTWTCQPPPPVNPLAAEVASLTSANNNLQGEVNSLSAAYTKEVSAYKLELAAATTDLATITTLKKELAADAALIAKLEAELKK
jgi:hypothetical protein